MPLPIPERVEIALYEPEIPPNTGNIGRLCCCTETKLHIIGKPAFSLDESAVRRAGLDYWDKLELKEHRDWKSFRSSLEAGQKKTYPSRILLFSRFSQYLYTEYSFQASDTFVFGGESKGLPKKIVEEISKENKEHILRIPVSTACRSLNLSNAVAIVLFEALRQQNFMGLQQRF